MDLVRAAFMREPMTPPIQQAGATGVKVSQLMREGAMTGQNVALASTSSVQYEYASTEPRFCHKSLRFINKLTMPLTENS